MILGIVRSQFIAHDNWRLSSRRFGGNWSAHGPKRVDDGSEMTAAKPPFAACGYSIPLGGVRSTNAVWTYESPYAAVAAIRDYLAFYPDRVDAIEERPGG